MSAAQTTPVPILLVEDDPTVSRALSSILADAGFATQAFTAGLPALTQAAAHPAAAAIIDIHLPDVNGLVLAQKLRERFGPDKPIIVLSGDTSMEVVNSLSLVGATYFFSKPVNSDELIRKLRELVGG